MKAATGDPIIHLGLFIGILFVPNNQMCNGLSYGGAITLLCVSHAFNALRFVMSTINVQIMPIMPKGQFKLYFFERSADTIGIVLHMFAIIFAQDVFFFTKISPTCRRQDFDATRSWLNLEIFFFYTTFIGNFLFILFSEFLLKKTGLVYL